MHDLLVGLGVTGGVGDISAEGGKERIDELLANLSLFELGGGVVGLVGGEGFDKGGDLGGQGHVQTVVSKRRAGCNAGF